jgi:hypothetical protein
MKFLMFRKRARLDMSQVRQVGQPRECQLFVAITYLAIALVLEVFHPRERPLQTYFLFPCQSEGHLQFVSLTG